MPFKRPTLKEIDDRIRTDITGAVRMTIATARGAATETARAAALLRRSVVAVKSRVYAGACHMLYGFLAWLALQRFVHSMEGEFLDAEGMTYAMARKDEGKAEGTIAATGTDGAAILVDTLFQHDDGMQYRVTKQAIVADGQALVSVEAVVAGKASNLPEGAVLTPTHPILGVDTEATVGEDGLHSGTDVESDELYRERILARKQQPPHGGAAHDYVAWAKEVKGVTRAWCLPLWMGEGTVGVMFLREGEVDPFPNEEQCQTVWDHIETVRPVTAEVFVITPEKLEVDIAVKLSPDTEDIRETVLEELDDFMFRDGQPDTYLYVSRLSEAISIATGEHHHELISPVNNVHVPKNAIPTIGRVVFIPNDEG